MKRPSPPGEWPSTLGEALERASLALRSQQPEQAERLAASVLRADRGNLIAVQILAAALMAQGRAAEAVELLQRATRRSDDPATETLLARALSAAGRRNEALDHLRQASQHRPAYPLAFLDLAEALGGLGRLDEAVAVLEQGLELIPAADGFRIALGYLHLKRHDRAAAHRLFLQVREAAPQRQDAMVGLAKVMVLDGEYAEAADLYRRALALRPDDVATGIALGKCLLEMDRREAGEAALRAAARGSPQLAGLAITALAASPHGRFFLRLSTAAKFFGVEGR